MRTRIVSALTLALALALGFGLAPATAGAEYRYLCTSIVGACDYTGPDVPWLGAAVCYSPTNGARLMVGSCPDGSWPYRVDYGEVLDPMTGEVAAYVPLDDACEVPGLCVDAPAPDDSQEYPMCCDEDYTCTNFHSGTCSGTIWFCYDGVCNDDGTVTCFHAIEAGP